MLKLGPRDILCFVASSKQQSYFYFFAIRGITQSNKGKPSEFAAAFSLFSSEVNCFKVQRSFHSLLRELGVEYLGGTQHRCLVLDCSAGTASRYESCQWGLPLEMGFL